MAPKAKTDDNGGAPAEEQKLTTSALALRAAGITVAGQNALGDVGDEFAGYEGAGFSGDASDQLIPFMGVLQDLSPQVKPRHAKFIAGARVGDILRTDLNQVIDGSEGFLWQQAFFVKRLVEWVPRDAGGGFRGYHDVMPENARASDPKKPNDIRLPDGNQIVETRYHYGNVLGVDEDGKLNGELFAAVIAMASTQHKVSRSLTSLLNQKRIRVGDRTIRPPSWASIFRVTTKVFSDNANEWMGWNFEDLGFISLREVRAAGQELFEAVESGAKAADEGSRGELIDSETGEIIDQPAQRRDGERDEIPI